MKTFESIGFEFEEVNGDIPEVIINKSDEISKISICIGEWTTYVTVDPEQRAVSMIGSFVREFETLNICKSANLAIFDMNVIDWNSGCGVLQPFNVYVAH